VHGALPKWGTQALLAGLFVGVGAFCEAVRDGIPGIVIRTVLVRPVLKPVVRPGIGC
jgi:hypothetical protein